MNYWVIIDNEKIGPMQLEEVLRLPLKRDTLVWHTGLPSWRQACFIPELAAQNVPASSGPVPVVNPYTQPMPSATAAPTPQKAETKPPTYIAWSIVAICLCCAIPAIVSLIYAAKVTPRFDTRDYEGARKASDNAELWLIVSITLGVMWLPFQYVLFML